MEYTLGVIDVSGRGVAVRVLQLGENDLPEFLGDDEQAKVQVTVDLTNGAQAASSVRIERNRKTAQRIKLPDDDQEAKESFVLSVRYAIWLNNNIAHRPVSLGIIMEEREDGQIPPLEGGSLFGPATLVLLKNACKKDLRDHKWLGSRLPAIRGTQLDRVASSAAFDPASGCFQNVTCLASKIAALSRLRTPPAALVLPEGNEKDVLQCNPPFKLVYSRDPAHAFESLFTLQALDTLFAPMRDGRI